MFPKQLLCCKADVCDDIQIDTAVKEIVAVFSSIDIAIHNACLCTFANENDTELNMYERVFNVNYYGGLRLAKRVLPYMQEQKRGKIILPRFVFQGREVYEEKFCFKSEAGDKDGI